MVSAQFDFDRARSYWKHAPSGLGKVDTATLLQLDDDEFFAAWKTHFDSRLAHYWEDRHFVGHFRDRYRGKRILSFGSGIGHNEVQFVLGGAHVTCADIVESNLQVIQRVCGLLRAEEAAFLPMQNSAETEFPGPFDHIYVRGSLMTMPAELQARALAQFEKALAPGGTVILNLYTWKFVADTTGAYDPAAFAKATDPSVGDQHCPWSDWHDRAKLEELAGPRLTVTREQEWNNGHLVWFEMMRPNEIPEPQTASEFLDLERAEAAQSVDVCDLTGHRFECLEATLSSDGVYETKPSQYHYAARSETVQLDGAQAVDKILLDLDLESGGISLGLLDVEKDVMAYSRVVNWTGRRRHRFYLGETQVPRSFAIVISNHHEKEPGTSRFRLHEVKLQQDEWPDRPLS